jgi:hypothetical protein
MTPTTQGSGMGGSQHPKGQPALSSALEAALKQAGLRVSRLGSMACGEVLEAEGPGVAAQSLVIFTSAHEGLQIGMKVTPPECSKLAGAAPTSDQSLLLLGALTTALNVRKLNVQAQTGANGLESYMITAHLCDDSDAKQITNRLNELRTAAQEVETALSSAGVVKDQILSLGRVSAYAPKLLSAEAQAAVVPSFDARVRDQLMKKAAERSKQ